MDGRRGLTGCLVVPTVGLRRRLERRMDRRGRLVLATEAHRGEALEQRHAGGPARLLTAAGADLVLGRNRSSSTRGMRAGRRTARSGCGGMKAPPCTGSSWWTCAVIGGS